ncbi:unnamed protein product, partial [Ectocarpus fasciculatus]
QTCSNGLAGYEKSGACCSVGCGTCGGEGCSQLGEGAESCCTSNIIAAGEPCSEKGAAPCVVDPAGDESTACATGVIQADVASAADAEALVSILSCTGGG